MHTVKLRSRARFTRWPRPRTPPSTSDRSTFGVARVIQAESRIEDLESVRVTMPDEAVLKLGGDEFVRSRTQQIQAETLPRYSIRDPSGPPAYKAGNRIIS